MKVTSTHGEFVPLQHYNFVIHDIPEVLAIILANETQYSVSKIEVVPQKLDPRQEMLHVKWVDIFYDSILKSCPNLPASEVGDISVRNANYLRSAFSPITIEYGVDLRTLGYLVNRFKRFISRGSFNGPLDFFNKLRVSISDFVQQIEKIFDNNLKQNENDGSLVSFERIVRRDIYGNGTFNRSCLMSLDCLFDMFDYNDRISCSWLIPKEPTFIVPHVIVEYGTIGLEKKWQEDISSIADLYPMGLLVKVFESGLASSFSRRIERLVTDSTKISFEMVSQACATMHSYKNALKVTGAEENNIFLYLDQYNIVLEEIAHCSCSNPCKRIKNC